MSQLVDGIRLCFCLGHGFRKLNHLRALANRAPYIRLEAFISAVSFIVGNRVGSYEEACVVESPAKLLVRPDSCQTRLTLEELLGCLDCVWSKGCMEVKFFTGDQLCGYLLSGHF